MKAKAMLAIVLQVLLDYIKTHLSPCTEHKKLHACTCVYGKYTNITDANTIVSDTCIHRQALQAGIILTLAATEAGSFLKRSVPLTFGSDFKSKIPIFLVGVAPSPSSFAAVGGE